MKSRGFFIVVFTLCTVWLHADIQDITFRRVSPPGGYSFQAVSSIKQDIYGYIWMGSFDGIIKYNSKEIVRYVYDSEDIDGLPSNVITSVAIDNQNNIWAATDKGLCQFNHSKQKFERVFYTYENGESANINLYSIELDGEGNLWIADEYYFGFFDTDKNQLVRITRGLNDVPRLLYNDDTNRMWLGTEDGSVYLVNQKDETVVKKIEGTGSFVRTIYSTSDKIWVGYESHGARLYDIDGNLKIHYTYSSNSKFDIKTASIRKIWRDTRGQLWIGSYYGLFLCEGSELTYFSSDEYEGLPHNSIYTLFEDKQGSMWIGTWSGGVVYLNYSDNNFSNFRHSKEPGTISDNMISSFAQAPNDDLYVGTELFGLNRFNPSTSTFSPINIRDTKSLLDIKDLEIDDNGGLWIATAFSGVFYRPEGRLDFVHFDQGQNDGEHVSSYKVYALCKSDSGMWIGTSQGGVNFYNFNTEKISQRIKHVTPPSISSLNIRTLSIDNNDNLWATSSEGVFQINLSSGKLNQYNISSTGSHKTRSQSFYFAKQLSDGRIWMGSSGEGIAIYDFKTDELSFFDANGLLKGKDVYGIIEGINESLWITSNDGLILYNFKDESSRRFEITDGIQGNLFNPNAIFRDRDDNLYFGGTNGFTRLEPKEIRINSRAPNILINNIIVNNRNLIPHQTGINKFTPIVLKPRDNTLNFTFSADNYLLPEKNRFKYKLTNYINDWVNDANNGSATFVNIKPGNYVFEVLACNNDGVWNTTAASLAIRIQQHWYKSELAYLLYIISILSIITLIVRVYIERLKLRKALLIETIKHEQEEQLHEMKLKFFTNVSHEFRTPLTLINGPIRQLINDGNLTSEQHKLLDIVKRNTNRLLTLINQIMDLRKVEKGLTKLNIRKVELVSFIDDRILNFSEEAISRNVIMTFTCNVDSCIIEADEEKLDKIIYNLLSNAFKFISENEAINITLQNRREETVNSYSNQLSFGELDTNDFIEISVQDTGLGINSQDMPNVFNRFEQGENAKAKNSTGIGLNLCKDFILMHRGAIIVQSTPGKGTRFSIQLPTKQKAQKIMYESHEKVMNMDSIKSATLKEPQSKSVNKNIHILVVEDNDDLRGYITGLLREYYNISFAVNGKRGLEVIKKHNVQLVISDVMMAEMDGFEFCQIIKSQIETSHIPVIMLTALSSVENKSIGLDKGADAYILKPFDEKVLLAQISNLLMQRKRLQESFAKKFIVKQPIDIGSLDNYFLNKINSIIEDNMNNEDFTVDTLASKMGFSRSQLHRKLKQISNHSTSEYICIVRIKKATTLLETRNYIIDEVAFKVGFNSSSYFSKCFRKIHGITPKEFLKGSK